VLPSGGANGSTDGMQFRHRRLGMAGERVKHHVEFAGDGGTSPMTIFHCHIPILAFPVAWCNMAMSNVAGVPLGIFDAAREIAAEPIERAEARIEFYAGAR